VKIAITGHSRGIGKALATALENEHEVIGFSRSNGYNISNPHSFKKILKKINDCDIFINNAYSRPHQTEMLKAVVKQWEGTDKAIINMSSMWCYYDSPVDFAQDYKADKIEQNAFIENKIRSAVFQPKIINVIPGLTNTDMISYMPISSSINPEDVAKTIKFAIDNLPNFFIREIVIDTTTYPYDSVKEWITHL